MRLTWDDYFMRIATEVAERSTCDRAHVGCVLVSGNHIISTGYNGSPSGDPHCDEVGHQIKNGHCIRTIHAEVNAVIQCAVHGGRTAGCTAYVTHYPCYECMKVLSNAGIVRVVFLHPYRMECKHTSWACKNNKMVIDKIYKPDSDGGDSWKQLQLPF